MQIGDHVVEAQRAHLAQALRRLCEPTLLKHRDPVDPQPQRRGVATRIGRRLPHPIPVRRQRVQHRRIGQIAVGQTPGPRQLARMVAAQPDRHPARRLRPTVPARRVVELAPERTHLALPQIAQHLQILVHPRPAPIERHRKRLELLLPPAHARAQNHPPAGQMIQRRDQLGVQHRRAHRQHQHRRAQLDPLRHRRRVGQQRQRLQKRAVRRHQKAPILAVGVVRPLIGPQHHVVQRPERVEARPFGRARHPRDLLRRGRRSDLGNVDADFHPAPPPLRGR